MERKSSNDYQLVNPTAYEPPSFRVYNNRLDRKPSKSHSTGWKQLSLDGLSYLESLNHLDIRPGLERMWALMDALGLGSESPAAVLVGGTNGKGSVSALVSTVLSECGYRTGLYTSPHLVSVTERIAIDGRPIERAELSELLLRVRDAARRGGLRVSYFEALTAAAFLWFDRRRVEVAVLEVGMGGRWDATNVTTPELSVVTNVSLDHTTHLGSTVEAIAREKAGIIKLGRPVVTGAAGSPLRVLAAKASTECCPLYVLGRDFSVHAGPEGLISYRGTDWALDDLSPGLRGAYQEGNVALAIASLETLHRGGRFKIREHALRTGLARTRWPGRFDLLSLDPPVVADAAHNPAGAKALARSLERAFPGVRFTLLIACSQGKDAEGILAALAPLCSRAVVTAYDSPSAIEPSRLSRLAAAHWDEVYVETHSASGLETALSLGGALCVTGSIYLLGEVLPALRRWLSAGETRAIL